MVNKGSFFQRLKDRWGSTSRVSIDRSSTDRSGSERSSSDRSSAERPSHGGTNGGSRPTARPASVERVEPERAVATGVPIEPRSSRKMSEREEAMLALNTQFKELTTLLQGSHQKVDDKLEKLVTATGALTSLPALGQQQLETLRAISVHMEKQSAFGEQMAATVTKLPAMLDNVEKALARAAATDERTAATVKEFHSTMDRIHSSMSKQVEATQKLAEGRDDKLTDLAKGIESAQSKALSELRTTTDESLKSLRRTHEDQSNRLQKVVESSNTWNRAVLVGLGLVVIGIGALIVLQLVK